MRRPLVLGLVLALGACGSAPSPRAAPPRVEQPAPPVVFLSRVMGEDPMVDDVTVGANRWVLVRRLRGGAGGRFDHYRLTPGELERLRAAVARLGRRPPAPRRRQDRWNYQLRIGRRPPYQFTGGAVPARARAAVHRLERLIDTSAQRDPARRPE